MAARKRSSNTDTGRRSPSASVKYEAVLWGVLAFSLILFISNFGIAGKAGNFISNIFFGLFGMIAYIFPIILFAGTAFMIANRNNTIAVIKITASVFFVIFTCMFLELIGGDGMAKSPFDSYAWAVEHRYGGGITGGLLVFVIRSTLGTISAYIIDIIVLIICMILITERSLWKRIQSGGKKVYVSARGKSIWHAARDGSIIRCPEYVWIPVLKTPESRSRPTLLVRYGRTRYLPRVFQYM